MISAHSSLIQIVVIRCVFQHTEALCDGLFLKGRDPQPSDRQFASCRFIHQAKNQFSFTSGICRTDNAGNRRIMHQLLEHNKLFSSLSDHGVFPFFRDDRKVLILPDLILFIVFLRHGGSDQVTYTPAHNKAMPLQITIMPFARAENIRNGSCDTGLFSNDKLSHFLNSSISKPRPVNQAGASVLFVHSSVFSSADSSSSSSSSSKS